MLQSFTMHRFFLILCGIFLNSILHAQYLKPDLFFSTPLDSLYILEERSTNTDSLAVLRFAIGRKFINNDGEKSIVILDEALQLAIQSGNAFLENEIRIKISIPLINTSKYQRARKEIGLSKLYLDDHYKDDKYIEWNIMMGFLETEIGNMNQAIQYFTEALKLATKNNNLFRVHDIYNRIGILNRIMGNSEKALEYYNRIIASSLENNVSYYKRAAYNNAASIYKEKKDTVNAIKYFTKVLEIRKNGTSKRNSAYTYHNKMQVAILENKYDQAAIYADSSLLLFQEIKLNISVSSRLLDLAYVYELKNDPKKSVEYVKRAVDHTEKWNLRGTKPYVFDKYAKILFDQKKYKEAYSYLNESKIIRDSINSKKTKIELEKLENKLATEKEQVIIEKLKIENDLQSSKIHQQNLKYYFMMILSIFLIGFISLLIRRSKERKLANHKLAIQNTTIEKNLQEKEILLKEIHHRVKNNLQIVSSMLNLQTKHVKNEEVLNAISESRNRVKSMALIHQKLYQHNNLKGVMITDYIDSLVSSLIHSFKLKTNINIHTEVDPICLDVDTTIPIGLILNELLTNAIKYAFGEEEGGNVWVMLKEKDAKLILEVKDDGVGLKDQSVIKDSHSFGYTLIDSLGGKLKAKKTILSENGLKVCLEISNYKKVKI